MPKYVIERNMPDAGKLDGQQLQAISQQSCDVLRDMGPEIQRLQSHLADDKIHCVYIAQRGELPADRVERVCSVIDPTTAE